MNQYILIAVFSFLQISQAQSVFEYSTSNNVEFKIYSENENILRKRNINADIILTTPEGMAREYFFATSNEILSSLYLVKEKISIKENSHFKNIESTPVEDMYVQLLHKTTYNFQGNERCYIMFIARIKGVDFPFPTLLSLVKKGNDWLIDNLPNQRKLTDCLMMFKPCVLSNLVEGKSQDSDINKLIEKTYSIEEGLDFAKLFNELVDIQNNEVLSAKLTMSQNLDCTYISFKDQVLGEIYFTGILENASIKKFREQDEAFISQIKKNNDSIVLTSKLEFDFSNKSYIFIKFDRISTNGDVAKESIRIDNNSSPEKSAMEFIFLFENLKTNIFLDLTPSMKSTPTMESTLYKQTRGIYDVLNITKLYKLYHERKDLLSNYFED